MFPTRCPSPTWLPLIGRRKSSESFYLSMVLIRLLRDSHLDLEIETLKENSRLILDLDSQICCENSHSHSQLSLSSSQKFEKSRLIFVDLIGNFFKITLQFLGFNHKDSVTNTVK